MLAIGEQLAGDSPGQVQLYLTDYRSLFVADVVEITPADQSAADPDHVPRYYRDRRLGCDCWFKLADIRRLVTDDTVRVVAELTHLNNCHYHDQPVSLYGGMVDLPLVVVRPDGHRFFDPAEQKRLLDDRTWAEFDAASAGIGAMDRELRDHLFGQQLWYELGTDTRIFLATAESIFRPAREEHGFDFSPVVSGLAKALEVECNRRLRQALATAPAEIRRHNLDGSTVDLARTGLSLGQWAQAMKHDSARQNWLRGRVGEGTWFVSVLPGIVESFARIRNPAAHSASVDRATASHWRDQLLGIGCQGVFARLAHVVSRD